MVDRSERNPLTRGLDDALTAQPCTLVIFGGSGDLSQRKLLPALYNLALDGVLPANFAVVGLGRKDLGDPGFRAFALDGIEKFSRRGLDAEHWEDFLTAAAPLWRQLDLYQRIRFSTASN